MNKNKAVILLVAVTVGIGPATAGTVVPRPSCQMAVPGFFDFTGGDEDDLPGGTTTLSPVAGDDRPQIQSAINTMSAAGGGKIYLNTGTYDVSLPLQLKSNVIMEGLDREDVIMKNTRRSGNVISWNVFLIGDHHPAYCTYGRPTTYTNYAFDAVDEGDTSFTISTDTNTAGTNSQTVWTSSHPQVGDMIMVTSRTYGEDGGGSPIPKTYNWPQFVKITAISGYTITIDEPFYGDLDDGYVFWGNGLTDGSAGGLPITMIENVIIRNLTIHGHLHQDRFAARNALLESIDVTGFEDDEINKGLAINGFYRSELRDCQIEYNDRAVELKHGSAMSVISENYFEHVVNSGTNFDQPHIGTGEGDYEIYFFDNTLNVPTVENPGSQDSFVRVIQYKGVFGDNTFTYSGTQTGNPFLTIGKPPPSGSHPLGSVMFTGNAYAVKTARPFRYGGFNSSPSTLGDFEDIYRIYEDWSGSTLGGYDSYDKDENGYVLVAEKAYYWDNVNEWWQSYTP